MTITKYETRFVDLARHAIIFLPTERERVRRFIDGLTFTIKLQMAKETRDDVTYQRAIDIARWIEMVHSQKRGSVSDKRPRYSGSFSGVSSEGRGTLGRGHPPKPFQSALQASHSVSVSRGPYVSHSRQLAYSAQSAPISAPPIHSYHHGYPARSSQLQLQQQQQQDGCFKCGGTGHIRRFSQDHLASGSGRGRGPVPIYKTLRFGTAYRRGHCEEGGEEEKKEGVFSLPGCGHRAQEKESHGQGPKEQQKEYSGKVLDPDSLYRLREYPEDDDMEFVAHELASAAEERAKLEGSDC
ncbi:uncharacterized protein [Nicotiana tomentosiformis]|uniref:uncharacterized protein n=1 Tax=Nicotiana tomentosiformis TaxID=4098 RepID=UPI00388C376F